MASTVKMNTTESIDKICSLLEEARDYGKHPLHLRKIKSLICDIRKHIENTKFDGWGYVLEKLDSAEGFIENFYKNHNLQDHQFRQNHLTAIGDLQTVKRNLLHIDTKIEIRVVKNTGLSGVPQPKA